MPQHVNGIWLDLCANCVSDPWRSSAAERRRSDLRPISPPTGNARMNTSNLQVVVGQLCAGFEDQGFVRTLPQDGIDIRILQHWM